MGEGVNLGGGGDCGERWGKKDFGFFLKGTVKTPTETPASGTKPQLRTCLWCIKYIADRRIQINKIDFGGSEPEIE